MAYSKLPSSSHDATTSLTECWICLSEMDNPKALPCLHSFCLQCLKRVKHPPEIFICPVCKDQTPLPSDGVDGFKDNFLINQLKDNKALGRKETIRKPCVSCGAEGQEILARCMDCNGFLCQQCHNLHQTIKPLKVHSVFKIDELQSGRTQMGKVTREENCLVHKDQVLRWFCRTCNIPICRDCTVMEHRHPAHDYITIESANEAQVKVIIAQIISCKGLIQELTNAITNTEKVELNLSKSVDNIRKQIDEERKAYLGAIALSYKETLDDLSQIQAEKFEKIIATKLDLLDKKTKFTNAVMEANQVITSGSKHDLPSNYSTLSKTLEDLQQIKIRGVSNDISYIKFKPSNKSDIKVDMGSISTKSSNPMKQRFSFKGHADLKI